MHHNEDGSINWNATIHYMIALILPFWDAESCMYPEGRALTEYERNTPPYVAR